MSTKPSKELETFPNPAEAKNYEIFFDCPEFTCLCPKTGQPDFAHIKITYTPDEQCVELKSSSSISGHTETKVPSRSRHQPYCG